MTIGWTVLPSCPLVTGEKTTKIPDSKQWEWVTDLRRYGYELDEFEGSGRFEAEKGIAFGSKDELVVLNQSVRKGDAANVRAFVLEAASGRLERKLTWAKGTPANVFPTATGEYAILQEKGTVLYSAGLKNEVANSPYTVEMISPNGRTFAARVRRARKEEWITLDARTLERSGTIAHASQPSISEGGSADMRWDGADGRRIVEIRLAGKQPIRYRPRCEKGRVVFVSETLLAVVGCGRFDVITEAGDFLFTGKVEDDGHHFSTDRIGDRMALAQEFLSEVRGGLKSEKITVFDLKRQVGVCRIELTALKGESNARSGAALSPDGSMLAVNSLGVIRLIKLPPVVGDGQGKEGGSGKSTRDASMR